MAIHFNFINYLNCHRLSERSFYFKGKQFPVCARCTGVYLGQIIMIILLLLGFKINLLVSIILMIPLVIDGTIQRFGILISNNLRRLITGFMCGLGVIGIYQVILIKLYQWFLLSLVN